MRAKLNRTEPISRRNFLKRSVFGTAGIALWPAGGALLRAAGANDRLRVAIVGCNGRGMAHISGWLAVPNVEIAYVCDVDRRAMSKGIAAVSKKQAAAAQGQSDFRKALADKTLDVVSIATPDHWHTPAAVLACAAGKHVYVEKPGSHNAHESELIVTAARKHKRLVQMGNQRRSWPWVIEAIEALRRGELGKVVFARCWYTNHRASIGHGKLVPVPEWLDYNLWQGPAPERPYKDNILHYNWHWFWNWGTGELGNNGVHALDLARWGMDLGLPRRVTAGGGRLFGSDDWETPDTSTVTFEFDGKAVVWEGQSCAPRGFENSSFGCSFYAENGVLVATSANAVFYDLNNKVLREINGKQKDLFAFDAVHFANHADAIRTGKSLRAEIEEGQKSTMLCHLGNIAWRSGETVRFDPDQRRLLDGKEARRFWSREYRYGWEPG
jgi:predicted dehydrogenase